MKKENFIVGHALEDSTPLSDGLHSVRIKLGAPPIDGAWLLAFLEAKTKRMLEIARAKNADYAGATSDPFGNFSRVESLGISTTETGFLVRMTDKLCRVASLLRPGAEAQVKDESVDDTLLDLSCYCLLLLAYRESKKLR